MELEFHFMQIFRSFSLFLPQLHLKIFLFKTNSPAEFEFSWVNNSLFLHLIYFIFIFSSSFKFSAYHFKYKNKTRSLELKMLFSLILYAINIDSFLLYFLYFFQFEQSKKIEKKLGKKIFHFYLHSTNWKWKWLRENRTNKRTKKIWETFSQKKDCVITLLAHVELTENNWIFSKYTVMILLS